MFSRREFLASTGIVGGVFGLGLHRNQKDKSIFDDLESLKESGKTKQCLARVLELISDQRCNNSLLADIFDLVADIDTEVFIKSSPQLNDIDSRLSDSMLVALAKNGDYRAISKMIKSLASERYLESYKKVQLIFALKSIIDPAKIGLARISDGTEPARRDLSESFSPRLLHQRPE